MSQQPRLDNHDKTAMYDLWQHSQERLYVDVIGRRCRRSQQDIHVKVSMTGQPSRLYQDRKNKRITRIQFSRPLWCSIFFFNIDYTTETVRWQLYVLAVLSWLCPSFHILIFLSWTVSHCCRGSYPGVVILTCPDGPAMAVLPGPSCYSSLTMDIFFFVYSNGCCLSCHSFLLKFQLRKDRLNRL
jgi:hypothetical protein